MSTERPILEDLENEDDIVDDTSQLGAKKIYSCEMCNIQVTGAKVLQRHMDGKKHKLRTERQGKTFNCELCNVVCNSESQLESHLKSTKHKGRLIKKDHQDIFDINYLYMLLIIFCCVFSHYLFKFISEISI